MPGTEPALPAAGRELAGIGRRTALRAGAGLLLGIAGCSGAPGPQAPASGGLDPAAASAGVPTPGQGSGTPSRPAPAGSGPPRAPGAGDRQRPGPAPTGPAVELLHATSGRPELALTFHGAGDPALARRVLEALTAHGASVTVLAVGLWLRDTPDVARMVTDLGHELGNHTWSHPVMSALPVAGQRAEIERCRDRIAELTGGPGAFFRQSSARRPTVEQLRLAGAAGYPRVLAYDVDSRDFTDPAPAVVRQRVADATAGSVVSMHLGHPVTLAALPTVLADLDRRGLRAVTASRLFDH